VREAIAARAVERLIAAGHDEDGAAPGLADVVEREAAVILSGETDDEVPDAGPQVGRYGAMLTSIHGRGEKRLVAPAGEAASAMARPLALQLASSSTACARSMMETSVAVRGQNQKAQMAAVDRFRRGEVNVLVATCIAEEGLDIGEVGLIVLYNAVRSPIRTIQRLGRTGRKTAGEAVSLCTEAEAKNFDEAFCAYRRIAQALREKQDRFKMCPCDPSA
jgi:ERCC4-related helicase